MDEITNKPYAQWLEASIKELFDIEPVAISMQMLDAEGAAYTCYWNVAPNDRAIMMDALREDGYREYIRNNKEEIREIMDEDEGEDDDNDGDA